MIFVDREEELSVLEDAYRSGRTKRIAYVLYSRSGFTFSGGGDVMLFSLDDVAGLFEEHGPRVEA